MPSLRRGRRERGFRSDSFSVIRSGSSAKGAGTGPVLFKNAIVPPVPLPLPLQIPTPRSLSPLSPTVRAIVTRQLSVRPALGSDSPRTLVLSWHANDTGGPAHILAPSPTPPAAEPHGPNPIKLPAALALVPIREKHFKRVNLHY